MYFSHVADRLWSYIITFYGNIFTGYLILLTSIFVLCFLLAYFLILPLMNKVPGEFLIPVKAVVWVQIEFSTV